ncbi:hypothetical protein F5Y18DRAFT_424011 [Xylariaceae sp. FL1019]|nr:hypothetical protein F5Y18DRAFT_424011 [Xylariaceae sp. FL1019]
MDTEFKQPCNIRGQSLAVGFIDNHARDYHAMFTNNDTQFNSKLGEYRAKTDTGEKTVPRSPDCSYVNRPRPPRWDSMDFWAQIFGLAMHRFRTIHPQEPKGRAENGCCIRLAENWEAVFAILQTAQEKYETPNGTRGNIKKRFRGVMKHTQPLAQIVALIPDVDYISPVVGTLDIIMKAAKRSMEVREDITEGIEALEQHFEDIDTYLKIFPEDENIVGASIALVSSTLKAVEDIIGYFLGRSGKLEPRYICALDTKLTCIPQHPKRYQLSSMEQSIKRSYQRAWKALSNAGRLSFIKQIAPTCGKIINLCTWPNIVPSLIISSELTEADILVDFSTLDKMAKQQQTIAATQNELKSCLDQLLENLANTQREKEELEHIVQKQTARLASHATTHYHINVGPVMEQMAPLYPSSSEILIYLNFPDLVTADVTYVLGRKQLISTQDRSRAERVVVSGGFRSWIVAPSSQKLLVHGDFSGNCHVSGLSLLCCNLIQALSERESLYRIAYFCGRHLDRADPHSGALGLINSMLSQLIQHGLLDTSTPSIQMTDWESIKNGSLIHSCALFESIMQHLPSSIVVVCIIDGVKFYERDQYVNDLSSVLHFLLSLVQPGRLQCVLKILITSPQPTTVVRRAFEQDCIMSMAAVSGSFETPNSSRVMRNLERDLA